VFFLPSYVVASVNRLLQEVYYLRQQIAVNCVGRLTFDPLINPEDVPSPYQLVEAKWELRWPSLF